ncbi:MAG: hypothetical protein RIG63_13510 [Coleofasciculus chthonoplastes F3-SA18-01]|uniref:hypothetical protein n=1 Tax=Coleofasciculus chthonoplastes TaxID=64178 RepID=UPI0032FD6838
MSLVQPTLRFGISSSKSLSAEQWQEIWQIWHYATNHHANWRESWHPSRVQG